MHKIETPKAGENSEEVELQTLQTAEHGESNSLDKSDLLSEDDADRQTFADRHNANLLDPSKLVEIAEKSAIDLTGIVEGLKKERETNEEWYIIMPNNPYKGAWDFFMLVMLLWIAILLPLQLAFIDSIGSKQWVTVVDYIVDVLFVLDMVLTCFVAKQDEKGDGRIEVDIRELTRRYVCGPMFAIDLIAVIPLELIAEGLHGIAGIKSVKIAKSFRFLRVLKALRMRNVHTKLQQLNNDPRCPTGTIPLFNGLLFLFVFAHIQACVYYAVTNLGAYKPGNGFQFCFENTGSDFIGDIFTVDGDCDIQMADGITNCVSSHLWPHFHGIDEECRVEILQDAVVMSSSVDLDDCCDTLVPVLATGEAVGAGTNVTWTTFRHNPWNWLAYGGYDQESLYLQYYMSIYWSITTLTTVGYGDINAKNNMEIFIAMITMFIGAITFSAITALVSNMFQSEDEKNEHIREMLLAASNFLKQNREQIPEEVHNQVWDVLKHRWQRKLELKAYDDRIENIYETLPPGFLKIVVYYVNENLYDAENKKWMQMNPQRDLKRGRRTKNILQEIYKAPGGCQILLELFTHLRMQKVEAKELVCIQGEVLDKLYFIESGKYEIFATDKDKGMGKAGETLDVLTDGDVFGIISEYYALHIHHFNVACVEAGILRYVKIENFRKKNLWHPVLQKHAKDRIDRFREKQHKTARREIQKQKRVEEMYMDAWLSPGIMREKVLNSHWFIHKNLEEDDIDKITIIDNNITGELGYGNEDLVKVRIHWTHSMEIEDDEDTGFMRQASQRAKDREPLLSPTIRGETEKMQPKFSPSFSSVLAASPATLRGGSMRSSKFNLFSGSYSPRASRSPVELSSAQNDSAI